MSASHRRLLLVVLFVLAGCEWVDVVARGPCARNGDCASGRCIDGTCAPRPDDASPGDGGGGDGGGFCEGAGPIVFAGDSTGTSLCSGDVAQTTFRYAICTCTQLAFSAGLTTDAFDSRDGPYTAGEGGAAVGTNGSLVVGSPAGIGGALFVAGASGITLAGQASLAVRGDLASGGPLVGDSTVQALGDARANGDVMLSSLQVGGTLTLPSGAALDVDPGPLSASSTVRAPVSVAPPCDCSDEGRIDIAAIVAQQSTSNDDAALGITPGELAAVASDRTLELPCGRYYLTSIETADLVTADVRLRALGRVVLFVDGPIDVSGSLAFELAPDGELDVFVSGSIRTMGTFDFGDIARPARSRLYVGAMTSIAIDDVGTFAGNLYAPAATIQSSATLEVYGSVFADSIQAATNVAVHYDRAVLSTGDGCPAPSGECTSCRDCGNQACTDGSCSPCGADEDCCSPLRCVAGHCGILVL